jgi:hypothetical protein
MKPGIESAIIEAGHRNRLLSGAIGSAIRSPLPRRESVNRKHSAPKLKIRLTVPACLVQWLRNST